jgi:hypothetical protein
MAVLTVASAAAFCDIGKHASERPTRRREEATMTTFQPVDRPEIQVLVDNVTDSLSSTPAFATREWVQLQLQGVRVQADRPGAPHRLADAERAGAVLCRADRRALGGGETVQPVRARGGPEVPDDTLVARPQPRPDTSGAVASDPPKPPGQPPEIPDPDKPTPIEEPPRPIPVPPNEPPPPMVAASDAYRPRWGFRPCGAMLQGVAQAV